MSTTTNTTGWVPTTAEKYEYALCVLPPTQTEGQGFLMGEPVNFRKCRVTGDTRPTYDAYLCSKGNYFHSSEDVTIPEFKQLLKEDPNTRN